MVLNTWHEISIENNRLCRWDLYFSDNIEYINHVGSVGSWMKIDLKSCKDNFFEKCIGDSVSLTMVERSYNSEYSYIIGGGLYIEGVKKFENDSVIIELRGYPGFIEKKPPYIRVNED